MFANAPGGSGDLVSTASALESLNLLGKLEGKGELLKNVESALADEVLSASETKFFSGSTVENAAGIIAASFTNMDLGDAAEWAAYFYNRQGESGGFTEEGSEGAASRPEDSFAALSGLRALEKATKASGLLARVDSRSLLQYVARLPQQLSAASLGFGALAVVPGGFEQVLYSQFTYETDNEAFPIVNKKATSGVNVRPSLLVNSVGPHAGLKVSLSARAGGKSTDIPMAYNPDFRQYVATSSFDTYVPHFFSPSPFLSYLILSLHSSF